MSGFDMLEAVDIDNDEVKERMADKGIGLNEAQMDIKTEELFSRLSDMRFRQDEFEDASTRDIVDALLDMLMAATNR